MTSRTLRLVLTSALLLTVMACSVEQPPSAGRPCSDEQPCGPGTTCDPASKVCVAGNGGSGDGGKDTQTADTTAPDTLQPDSFVAPDGGCPKGLTRCGNVCANLKLDSRHCGGCNKACPSSRADRCLAGKCSCGAGGKVCGASLDCKTGKCICVANGNCAGCCWGATCREIGSGQTADKCGKNGVVCKSCYDGNPCTSEGCSMGVCFKKAKPTGTACDDKSACTHSDKCSAAACKGIAYTCKPGKCQASSACNGKGGCKVSLKADNTACSDGISCTYSDKCKAGVCKGSSYTCKPGVCQAASVCNGSGGCVATPKANGTACNDGASCTYGDQCISGACKGTYYSCSDALTCTSDSCLGTAPPSGCKNTLLSGYCKIAGKCYSSGAKNPANACQKCVPGTSTTTWTGSGTGCVSTLAGTGASSIMWNPADVALGPGGKVYVADRSNSRILVVSGGKVTVLSGTAGSHGYKDGAVATALFNKPQGIAVGASGRVYVADRYNHAIRMIQSGQVYTIGGKGGTSGYYNGAASTSLFYNPHDVEVDASETVYVADTGNKRVRKIKNQVVTTVAGTGVSGYQDGSALQQARFALVYGVAVDTSGAIYVADGGNHRIRKVYNGQVSTFAGTGTTGLLNGAATVAAFYYPQGVAVGASGTIYVAARNNHVIRKISGGIVSTLAGSGSPGFGDGALTTAEFKYPFGLCYAPNGKVFVADYDNNRIRMITP